MRRTHELKPLIAAVGSCCLVGIIWKGTLFVANLGDSRAVVGRLGRLNAIIAEQVTEEHNASLESVRRELMASHPDDSHIVVLRQGVWRIKGIIQVSFLLQELDFLYSRTPPKKVMDLISCSDHGYSMHA